MNIISSILGGESSNQDPAEWGHAMGNAMGNAMAQAFMNKMGPSSGELVKSIAENAEKIGLAVSAFFKGIAQGTAEANDDFTKHFSKTFMYRVIPLIALTGAVSVGLPLVYRFTFEYAKALMLLNMGKPPMALKARTTTLFSELKRRLIRSKQELAPEPIFKEDLNRRIENIIESTRNIKNNGSFFQNIIFHGPGGTGKTMIAERIAIESGMDYMMMSGGDLGQFIKRGEHVSEFNKLWKAAEKSKRPTVIFIDEAEGLCKSRDHLDQDRLELQNAFLSKTGGESKQILVILATNRIKDIDHAVNTRMTHKIFVGNPGLQERVKIIDMYIGQFFENAEEREQYFTPEVVMQMAQKTKDFSARTLSKMINVIFSEKGCSKENQLSKEMIQKVVNVFHEQERDFLVSESA